MRYVALLSGGKDSCYNLLHCAKHGHELIATASLGPGPGKEEIDSYLYQTVGQDAIQLVADALEVPLVRRVITGQAVQKGSEYGSRLAIDPQGVTGDETEDLLMLLSEVKTKYPQVQGVSVGAILSNYQRVRVEHVCQRLFLTPLCYLWQRDQSELLDEMIHGGVEAILIKVAGIGLTTKHLGKSLSDMQPLLLKLHSLYGAHVCGEGGEYESLTLDLPLFKHRIILDEVETVIHSDNSFATVAYLKVKRAHLEMKLDTFPSAATSAIISPPLFTNEDERVNKAVSEVIPIPHSALATGNLVEHPTTVTASLSCKKTGPWVVISGVEAIHPTTELSVEDEVRSCFDELKSHLAKHSLDLSHVANIMLLISSMESFPSINKTYASFFGVSPPARACVAVDLPSSIRLRLECIAYTESQPHHRQSLHVQSLSYWAPANIGPYSQAISAGGRVFVSGQIGLIPSSNKLPCPQSLAQELPLSLRHVCRVANAVTQAPAVRWNGATQGVISWLAFARDLVPVQLGMMVSEAFRRGVAPTLFVVIKSLPKDALVETQTLLYNNQNGRPDEDDNEPRALMARFSAGDLSGLQVHWQISYFENSSAFLAIITCKSEDDENTIAERITDLPEIHNLGNTFTVRLFHTSSAAPDITRLLNCLFGSNGPTCPVLVIPSRIIATWERSDWDYAICLIG